MPSVTLLVVLVTVTVAEDRTRERTVEGAPMEVPVAKSLNGARVAILKSDVPYACSFLYGYTYHSCARAAPSGGVEACSAPW